MKEIKISFWKRWFVGADRNNETIRGYERAIIKTSEGLREGRIIDTDRLKELGYIDTEVFHYTFPLEDCQIDLASGLEKEVNGREWLKDHRKYFKDTFGETIPLSFSMKQLNFPTSLTYTIYPKDYFDRVKKHRHYLCPKGSIVSLPKDIVYWKISPPMKFSNGNWIPNIYYNRSVKDIADIFDHYSIQDPSDTKHFSAEGTFFGILNEEEIKDKRGDFENCFPFRHFLKIVYPVALRQAHKYSPLSIIIELEN